MGIDKEECGFLGKGASSEEQTSHYRCPCGELFPCQSYISIDALANPELACRASETNPERALNALCCPVCGNKSEAQLPFTYHNGTEKLFVLVLPESYRNRELSERARLYQELGTDAAHIPTYVLEFSVVYGPEGLGTHLSQRAQRQEAEERSNSRASDLKIAGDKVATREAEIAAREAEISDREEEVVDNTERLDRRSSELTERELNLRDRKGALDRRSSELEVKTEQLHKAQLAMRIETDGEGRDTLPEILRENSTVALEIEDILTSAASDNPKHSFSPSDSVTGTSSVGKRPEAPIEPGQDSPFHVRQGLSPEDKTPSLTGPADGKTRVSAPNPILASHRDANAQSESDFVRWKNLGATSSKGVREGKVELRARIEESAQGELGAQDLRALLQLHRMESYALVTLTLATANTLSGQPGAPFSFHFDVADSEDRKILEMLSEDFSFSLSVFDSLYEELRVRTVAAPLASNVRYVVALAKGTLETIDSENRSFVNAVEEFGDDQYDRLGRGHEMARLFRDSVLDTLKKTGELQAALRLCETFSEAAHEEYLIATRSYPMDRWTRRRLRVIGKSLKAGLWLGNSLAQIAVSEELAGSRKELVSQSQKNFSRYAAMSECGLNVDEIAKNWEFLDQEAERLGISVPGAAQAMIKNQVAESTTIPKDRNGEDVVLLAALDALEDDDEDEDKVEEAPASSDLSTLTALCTDNPPGGIDVVFRLLTELYQEEAPEGFSAVIGLGVSAAEPLRLLLDCPTTHLRQGAALALCELRDAQGIDSVCELLVSCEGLLWHELAVALGHVGESAVMPIVARVAQGDEQTATRGGWALAHIAALGGTKPVETLSQSKNSNVARVATAALELGKKIRRGDWATIKRGDTERAFTTHFYQSRQFEKRAQSELSGPMMLDESDLMEAVE